jgi:tetratricopeptide (TPR) repeat protein
VLTRTDRDLDVLMSALRPKVLAEDIVGYEARIRAEPASAPLHDDLALLLLEQGDADRAVEQFRQSLALRPGSAAAQFNYGTALAFAGREADAIEAYAVALRLRPDYGLAHVNLGGLLLRRGALDAAEPHLREAVRLEPANPDAQQNFGLLLRARGQQSAARDRFQRAASGYAAVADWPHAATATELALALAEEPLATELRQQLARYRARTGATR